MLDINPFLTSRGVVHSGGCSVHSLVEYFQTYLVTNQHFSGTIKVWITEIPFRVFRSCYGPLPACVRFYYLSTPFLECNCYHLKFNKYLPISPRLESTSSLYLGYLELAPLTWSSYCNLLCQSFHEHGNAHLICIKAMYFMWPLFGLQVVFNNTLWVLLYSSILTISSGRECTWERKYDVFWLYKVPLTSQIKGQLLMP